MNAPKICIFESLLIEDILLKLISFSVAEMPLDS